MPTPKDKQNPESIKYKRFEFSSGNETIHGMSNYVVQTQEAQTFGFYADTGQGKSETGGPGTGKAVLYTPGSSTEVLGEGLKVRNAGDVVQLPAKIIKCKRGDTIIECENGDVTIRGRNINIEAVGGGQDGVINIKGNRIIDVNAPDIRFQGEKIASKATKDLSLISEGFTEMKSAFTLVASQADEDFGVMAKTLIDATSIIKPKIGEATKSIEKKLEKKFSEIDPAQFDSVRDGLEGIANQAGEAFGNLFPGVGGGS